MSINIAITIIDSVIDIIEKLVNFTVDITTVFVELVPMITDGFQVFIFVIPLLILAFTSFKVYKTVKN